MLTPAQVKVLEKGLGFVPTENLDTFLLWKEIQDFLRKLKLHIFFKDKQDLATNQGDTGLRPKSTFTPPDATLPVEVLTFEKAIMKELVDIDTTTQRVFHNITAQERKAIIELSNNPNLVIKPADKGGAIVIQSLTQYDNECRRLLQDTEIMKS